MKMLVTQSIWLFVTPWTVAHQALLSIGFFRQVYWSGLPFPPPGNLPDPEIEPASPPGPALAGRFFTNSTTWKSISYSVISNSLWPHGLYLTRPLCPWNSPGKNTRVGCHSLLQRIFPTLELNLRFLHWQADALPLSYQESAILITVLLKSVK